MRQVSDDSAPLLLGIDLGTTAVKCAVYRADGTALASASSEYDLLTPGDMVVEVAAETYWRAVRDAVGDVMRSVNHTESIEAIGFSCQGETLLPVDANNQPLHKAIVWLDGRAEAEAEELSDRFGSHFYEVTGQTSMVPTWPAAKVLWLLRHEPEVVERAAKMLLLEDYVVARMTGEYVCEGSLLTSTGYWDFRRKDWWPEMLDAVGLRAEQLPRLVEPGSSVGALLPEVAAELGLSPSTVVCTGALDQACGTIGVGNVQPGIFSENTGAAVAICATLPEAMLDPERRMPCHYHGLPDTYMLHSFTGGGVVLQWYRDEFCGAEREIARNSDRSAYELMDLQAAAVAPGAEGLVVVPHLQGAMAPEADSRARGALVGLTLRHGKRHVARAVLESIAYVIRHNVEVIETLGVAVDSIRALGGGARSPIWKQIEADVTGRPVTVTTQTDAATLGACILAALARKWYWNAAEAVDAMVSVERTFEPNPETSAVYDDAYASYRAAVNALRPFFGRERP